MKPLPPLFSYFGAKHRTAKLYPPPVGDTIIEPFAGSAAYACRYPEKRVILYDKYPVIAGIWDYLIKATTEEILALPLIQPGELVSDMPICQEAKWLIGFHVGQGSQCPRNKPSPMANWHLNKNPLASDTWSAGSRARIAHAVPKIKHWRIHCASYDAAPDIEATWFVDPPYQGAGIHYKESSKQIDFARLGEWCRQRKGRVIVCENMGADWLPFAMLKDARGMEGGGRSGKSAEAIWTNDGSHGTPLFGAIE